MVRYPHRAVVVAATTTVTDGEYSSESAENTTIKGRLEPSSGFTRAKNPDGQQTEVKAKFFTKSVVIAGAKTVTVNGETYRVIKWWPFQSHTEIWLED